ncbi:hypothetical protein ACIQVR_39520 [Streptomyces xanthochromogenes]|uniref:hypothetical protein n=1 Tax=Streptomyces xanthochromogenes TaxID=67384 RepID=UPI0038061E18
MATKNLTQVRPGNDQPHPALVVAAAHEPLRRVLREPAPLAVDLRVDDDSDYRARLIELYATASDWRVKAELRDEARRYDKAHPGELSLQDELLGVRYGAVA